MDSADPLCKYCGYTTESCLEIALGCWIEGTCLGQFNLAGDAHDQNSEKIAKWIVDNNRYTSFCVKGQREKRIALQSRKLCKKKKVIKSGQCVCIFSLFVLPKSLYIDRIGITDNTGL